jgi:hypothetical protein
MKNRTKFLYKLYTFTVFFICIQSFFYSASAQNNEDEKKDSVPDMSWITKSFVFDKPDTGFIILPEGNGYRNNFLDATIKYISLPGNYNITLKDFASPKSTESSLIIDTITHKTNGRKAFTVITEEISPDKNKYENYIMIITVVDFSEMTVGVLGVYPKSKGILLQEKYIKAALSIKEE